MITFVRKAYAFLKLLLTAGWSSGQAQTMKLEVPGSNPVKVVGRGFLNEQLHLLTSHGCLYRIIINVTYTFTIYVCLSVILNLG
jgi:hypothetical protein